MTDLEARIMDYLESGYVVKQAPEIAAHLDAPLVDVQAALVSLKQARKIFVQATPPEYMTRLSAMRRTNEG